jgi:L-2-hydroxyglutarate oxidase
MNHLSSYNSTPELDVLVIGGGIGGLSGARVLNEAKPGAKIVLLEKEAEVGRGTSHENHNTNTGHTGAFYKPGSLKATSAREGFHWLREYHDEKGLKRRDTGKIIAGTLPEDIGLLQQYFKQALANGQRPESVKLLDGDELRAEQEPFLSPNVTQGYYC